MIKRPWVLIVAVCPKASDSQSEPNGLAVRADGLNLFTCPFKKKPVSSQTRASIFM